MIALLLTIVFLGCSTYLYTHVHDVQHRKLWHCKTPLRLHSLCYYEAYKFIFINKAGILFAIFLTVNIYHIKDYQPYIDIDQYYYQTYSRQLQGASTKEKDTLLYKEEKKYERNHINMETLQHQFQEKKISEYEFNAKNYEYSKVSNSEKGFRIAAEQYKEIKKQKGVYIDQSAYIAMFGSEAYKTYVLQFICICLLLILGISPIMTIEYTTGMNPYLNPMIFRLSKVDRRKKVLVLTYGILVFLIGISIRIIKVFIYYQGGNLTSPIKNLLSLNTTMTIPIYLYLGIWLLIGIIIIIILSYVYIVISKKAEREGAAIFFSTFTLLPMLALYLLL